MRRSSALILASCVLLLDAVGCQRTESPSTPKESTEPHRATTVVIGLLPEQNIFRQMDRYEPIARYLGRKAGVQVTLTILPRYGNIVSSFVSSGMDGAFFGSFTYALAHTKLGVEALARPEGLDGVSTYYGMIFVRKDSGIRTVEDMRGRRFAFVDKATTAGYLLPLAYFAEHGKDHRSHLRESYFAGTHEDVIFDVLNRKADIGAAKNTVFARLAASDERIAKELIVLAESPRVPENALAVRKDLDSTIKRALRDALVTMADDPEGAAVLKTFGARRFIRTEDSDYRPVYEYARQIKLDLSSYHYSND
jgi:phosphonate transport system substrate-binding protein